MLNSVQLIGNLGSDVELRYTPSGTAVANMRVATNERWTDQNGQKQERVEWHRVVAWGKLAELCKEYLSKGRQVYLSGSLQTRQWEDRDGNQRYTTEVKARDVKFLGSRGLANEQHVSATQEETSEDVPTASLNVANLDEVPF